MRTVFHKYFVFRSKQKAGTTYEFLLQEGHDGIPERWVEVDLSKNSQSLMEGEVSDEDVWKGVQVDAGGEFSPTLLKGWFHPNGWVGAIYLAAEFATAQGIDDLFPPAKMKTSSGAFVGKDYEFKTAVYWPTNDFPKGIRFYGFHSNILKTDGPNALVATYVAGTSQRLNQAPLVPVWVKLNDRPQIDLTNPNGLTEIGTEVGELREGALFVNEKVAFRTRKWLIAEPSVLTLWKNGSAWLHVNMVPESRG